MEESEGSYHSTETCRTTQQRSVPSHASLLSLSCSWRESTQRTVLSNTLSKETKMYWQLWFFTLVVDHHRSAFQCLNKDCLEADRVFEKRSRVNCTSDFDFLGLFFFCFCLCLCSVTTDRTIYTDKSGDKTYIYVFFPRKLYFSSRVTRQFDQGLVHSCPSFLQLVLSSMTYCRRCNFCRVNWLCSNNTVLKYLSIPNGKHWLTATYTWISSTLLVLRVVYDSVSLPRNMATKRTSLYSRDTTKAIGRERERQQRLKIKLT